MAEQRGGGRGGEKGGEEEGVTALRLRIDAGRTGRGVASSASRTRIGGGAAWDSHGHLPPAHLTNLRGCAGCLHPLTLPASPGWPRRFRCRRCPRPPPPLRGRGRWSACRRRRGRPARWQRSWPPPQRSAPTSRSSASTALPGSRRAGTCPSSSPSRASSPPSSPTVFAAFLSEVMEAAAKDRGPSPRPSSRTRLLLAVASQDMEERRQTSTGFSSSKLARRGKGLITSKGQSAEAEKALPSKDELQNKTVGILKKVDFNTATFSDIVKLLGEHYKMDLSLMNEDIKLMICDELIKIAEADED